MQVHLIDRAENKAKREMGRAQGYGWLAVSGPRTYPAGIIYLACNRVMFGDIDTEPSTAKKQNPFLKDRSLANDTIDAVAADKSLCFRVYETYAGLRLIELTQFWTPKADDCMDVLKAIGADPPYIKMTRRRNSFNVRFSPKPARATNPIEVNFNLVQNDPDVYLQHPQHSIANYIRTSGTPPATLDPEIEFIVNLHDASCCFPALSLA